jgi:Tol biopolymer transport system component/tRNA A-37 threonylcarbamoyl transferase component Bud32
MPTPLEHLTSALADRYTIEREVGSGGMATVYLAEDVRHHRKVAIKVLRPELATTLGPERFLREIEIAARLTHPHILPLLDSGEAAGFLFYVMPFIEGESLRARLDREGELPVPNTVRLLRDVVDALAAAHRQGVVHRDIKPDNVLLLGQHALVTDFGVAKAVHEATGRQQLTTAGVALGTPSYMSPEQASASPNVDHRADIYAVGAMAYEMLTGQPPFAGRTPQETLAAHVTEQPQPVTARRAAVPRVLAEAVMRALAKKPADRWQGADDLLAALEQLMTTPSGGSAPTAAVPAVARRRPAWLVPVAGVVVVAALLGTWFARRGPPPITLGRSDLLTTEAGLKIHPAISPDGKLVAYAAGNQARMRIFVRPVAGGRTIQLSDDTSAVENQPAWSPDGSRLLFLTHGGVSVAPALGGGVRSVIPATAASEVVTATWSPDGREIAFRRGDSLLVGPAEGGATRLVAARATEIHSCRWSPDGRWIACVSGNISVTPGRDFGNLAPSGIVVVPASGGTPSPVTDGTALHQSPVWGPDGRLLFVSNRDGPRDIYALTLTAGGRPRGSPVRLTTGLGVQALSMTADGRGVAYNTYSHHANIWAVPIPTGAPITTAGATQFTSGSQVIESMRVSPDGRWLLYDSDLHGNADIYRIPLTGGPAEQLTNAPADEFAPDLSPDGRLLAYHTFRNGSRDIEVKPLDGGAVEQVTDSPKQESYPRWAPDGRNLVFYDQGTAQQSVPEVMTARREGAGRWTAPRILGPGVQGDWSPDGRAVAFLSLDPDGAAYRSISVANVESGAIREVYLHTATTPAAESIRWAADSRTLFFKSHDELGRASLWSVAEGQRPRLLVRFPDLGRPSNRADFATDGRRFYFTIEDYESDVYVAAVSRR